MAKTLIDLGNELIDVTLIKTVEKHFYYDSNVGHMVYSIYINKSLPENVFTPKWNIVYNSEKLRDEAYDILKAKLDKLEYVKVI